MHTNIRVLPVARFAANGPIDPNLRLHALMSSNNRHMRRFPTRLPVLHG